MLWRFDTRIYGAPIERPRRGDRPLGCIVGKNPGSARPFPERTGNPPGNTPALEAIELGSDRFLPTVRAIVRKSHGEADLEWPARHFVQVFNLFYLCNRNLREAKAHFSAIDHSPRCPAERRRMPWTWFAWGGPDAQLDPLKLRFTHRRWRDPFFYDTASDAVQRNAPGTDDHARHTQGMPHRDLVAVLARLLTEQAQR